MLRNGATVWTANDSIAYHFVRIFLIILVWKVAGLVEKKKETVILAIIIQNMFSLEI